MSTVKAFFHYCLCIWRKVQGCGLATRQSNDGNIKKLRRETVLPLMEPEQAENVWLNALEVNEDFSLEVRGLLTTLAISKSIRTFAGFST